MISEYFDLLTQLFVDSFDFSKALFKCARSNELVFKLSDSALIFFDFVETSVKGFLNFIELSDSNVESREFQLDLLKFLVFLSDNRVQVFIGFSELTQA